MKTKVYCIYFEGDNPIDTDSFDSSYPIEETAEKELEQSTDTVTRVDVYKVPTSMKGLMTSEIELDRLGECQYTAER